MFCHCSRLKSAQHINFTAGKFQQILISRTVTDEHLKQATNVFLKRVVTRKLVLLILAAFCITVLICKKAKKPYKNLMFY